MKKILILLVICSLKLVSQTWQIVPTGVNNLLEDIQAVNETTLFAAGDNIILKSTNGGSNWSAQMFSNPLIRVICFVNQNTGYFSTNFPNKTYKTTNGGTNWELKATLNEGIAEMSFSSSDTGYAVGGPRVFKTTNGGTNFVEIYNAPGDAETMFRYNNNRLFTAGLSGWTHRTANGVTWTDFQITPANNHFWDVYFTDSLTGYICGELGRIYKTTNFGANWSQQTSGFTGTLYGMHFVNSNTGYCVGDTGKILKTTNAGTNWNSEVSGTIQSLRSIHIYNNVGYISGENGVVLKNSALVSIYPISIEIPDKFFLSQNYPNPFNPVTKIKFDISGTSVAQTFLFVYDMLGREVEVLVNKELSPGTYEVDFDGSKYASGIYYYSLKTFEYTEVKKMVLIK